MCPEVDSPLLHYQLKSLVTGAGVEPSAAVYFSLPALPFYLSLYLLKVVLLKIRSKKP